MLRLSIAEHEKKLMGLVLNIFLHYELIGLSLPDCIITGDETWAHHSTPETKRSSSEWRELRYAFWLTVHCQGQLHVYWLVTRFLLNHLTCNFYSVCSISKIKYPYTFVHFIHSYWNTAVGTIIFETCLALTCNEAYFSHKAGEATVVHALQQFKMWKVCALWVPW